MSCWHDPVSVSFTPTFNACILFGNATETIHLHGFPTSDHHVIAGDIPCSHLPIDPLKVRNSRRIIISEEEQFL